MIPAQLKGLQEVASELTLHIESGVQLDPFTLKNKVAFAERLESDVNRHGFNRHLRVI
ncbi:hypothetical protein [uncultured Pantoea sp.]|uniref:hypothetical protein n=1 Tax=uncultured Pantoea sp. TaxID=218084 RepID=UPI0025FEF3EF|nr:hypothetical protein [uncultured Pantoea sp.]